MPLRCRVSLVASFAGLAQQAAAGHHEEAHNGRMTCGEMKNLYRDLECCGEPTQDIGFITVPNPITRMTGTNMCDGQKALTEPALDNTACFVDSVRDAAEQAGGDVTAGFVGEVATPSGPDNTPVVPITARFHTTALCPVNVHWHLGAEHRSAGQFDELGVAPGTPASNVPDHARRLTDPRYGYACRHYDASDTKFTTEYAWQHCLEMTVGETYEVHWPHSALGACGTPYQYQTPFYDGVFCNLADTEQLVGFTPQDIASNVGVQAQVFTIVNDEAYFYPDLMRGMLVDGVMGADIGTYTGSTTGTSRDNEMCSAYAPITWQVDRTCHLISASSFDKMCADMKQQRDDLSGDLHPHGARELVFQNLTASNQADIAR